MSLLVVGTDGSKGSEAAIHDAIDLARRLDATLLFVAVAHSAPDYLGNPHYDERVRENHARAREALDQARASAEAAGIEADYDVLEGDPAEEVPKLAEARKADLVVVGTRGRGAVVGALLGSVSSAIVRRSNRPVVVVREPGEQKRGEEAARKV